MECLPERRRLILQVIEDAVREQGYPPTVREIGSKVGLASPASVQGHLAALEAEGYIRRGASKRRALELTRLARPAGTVAFPGPGRGLRSVPLVGRVAAGAPLLAEENIEDTLDIPGFLPQFLHHRAHVLFRHVDDQRRYLQRRHRGGQEAGDGRRRGHSRRGSHR